MKLPIMIVLEALAQGQEIDIDGTTVVMDAEDCLAWKATNEKKETVLMQLDIPFNFFAKYCNKIPKDKLALISADTVLNKLKHD